MLKKKEIKKCNNKSGHVYFYSHLQWLYFHWLLKNYLIAGFSRTLDGAGSLVIQAPIVERSGFFKNGAGKSHQVGAVCANASIFGKCPAIQGPWVQIS